MYVQHTSCTSPNAPRPMTFSTLKSFADNLLETMCPMEEASAGGRSQNNKLTNQNNNAHKRPMVGSDDKHNNKSTEVGIS